MDATLKGNESVTNKIRLGTKAHIFFIILFLFSLLVRLDEYSNYREFNSDKARQLQGAYNLLHGKGVSFVSYDLNNFTAQVQAIIDWPPAYSYLTAGISWLTKTDLYTTSIIVDVVATIALWAVLFWATNLLEFSVLQKSLLFLFIGISKVPLNSIYSADLIGIGLFLFSSCLTINLIKSGLKASLPFYILQAFCIFFLVFLKYSLLPFAVCNGLALVTFSFFHKNKSWFKTGLILIGLAIISTIFLFWHNQLISGQNMGEAHKFNENVFHPESLKMFSPFVAASLIFLDPFYLRFDSFAITFLSRALTILFILSFVFYFFRRIRTRKADYLDHLLLISLAGIIGFLAFLSVTHKIDKTGTILWTYVKEFRYYGPVIFLIFLFLFKNFKFSKPKLSVGLMASALVGICVVFAVGLKAYYLAINNSANSFINNNRSVLEVGKFLKQQPSNDFYFVPFTEDLALDARIGSMAAFNGHKIAMTYYKYFPPASYNVLFNYNQTITPGKEVIVFIDKNTKILERINKNNNLRVETDAIGGQYVFIKN
ncbi:MAG: hypothetical protein ABIP31_06890 [Chitinophagaceae bacterium]